MKKRMVVILALALTFAGALAAMPRASVADAASPAATAQARHGPYTDAELDQMLAPIALYPDQLLTQILMASTYPLEIVEADRWVRQPDNAALSGSDLDTAVLPQPWEPSVKSLVPFPQVLHMMDDNLSWTEQLGDAFLSDQARVMNSVQRLRKQAQDAGHLDSTQYQTVQTQGSQIVIVPAAPDVVYVPVYDPFYVYGAWPYPGFPPYYFTGYFSVSIVGGFGWFGFSIVQPLWGWCDWDWGARYVVISPARYNYLNAGRPRIDYDRWRHDPYHRHGVPYPTRALRERYRSPAGPGEMRRFRGYPLAQPPMTPGLPARPGMGAPEAGRGGAARPQMERQRETEHQREMGRQPEMGGQRGTEQPRNGEGGPGAQRQREFQQQYRENERFRAPQTVPRQTEAPRFEAPRERAAPPAFESFGRSAGEIRMQSERGFSSRQSQPGGGSFRRREFGGGGGGDGGGFRGRERR